MKNGISITENFVIKLQQSEGFLGLELGVLSYQILSVSLYMTLAPYNLVQVIFLGIEEATKLKLDFLLLY